MVSLPSLAAGSLVLLHALVASSPLTYSGTPRYFQPRSYTRRDLTATTVEAELGPLLSNGTLIYGPSSPEYAGETSRWITFVQPQIEVVVEVAAESDVAQIVRYCNDNSIQFLTRNRGHGGTRTLNAFNGLQISMSQLQGIDIDAAGETVLLQGGAYSGPTIANLWDNGFVTSTGSAYCVGLAGLGLGGGHGRLEGLYGLVADGFVHLNVVLADGTEIGVNETSHADLFWAMKGAGHNYGIVTSFRARIYPRPQQTWHFHTYVWTGDKLEAVIEALNDLHVSEDGSLPVLLSVESGIITMDLSISETEPVLRWSFTYNGPAEDAEALLAPFSAIEAVSETGRDVQYPDIALLQGTGEQNATCVAGPYILSSNTLVQYNTTTERQLYDLFVQKIAEYPDLRFSARYEHEGYSNRAVQAIPYESTAYPHRGDNLIVYFLAAAPEGSDLQEPAEVWAQEARDIWSGSEEPRTYLNYASGFSYESVGSLYGYEPWRLDRLRGLKAEYDPQNNFRYYNPIIRS